jgi:hypothetical protein
VVAAGQFLRPAAAAESTMAWSKFGSFKAEKRRETRRPALWCRGGTRTRCSGWSEMLPSRRSRVPSVVCPSSK